MHSRDDVIERFMFTADRKEDEAMLKLIRMDVRDSPTEAQHEVLMHCVTDSCLCKPINMNKIFH